MEPLKDVQLTEGQDAHFCCRLSRASGQEARWALEGVPLQANEMNDIGVDQGVLYTLTLHKVCWLPWGTPAPNGLVGWSQQPASPALSFAGDP